MRFRFLPKGLFPAADRHGRRLTVKGLLGEKPPGTKPEPSAAPPQGCCTFPDTCGKCMPPPKKEDRYGDDKTIHSTGEVNVELGPDGNVVAVWYRCRMLPFTQTRVDPFRALEMLENPPGARVGIKAIVFDTQERRDA